MAYCLAGSTDAAPRAARFLRSYVNSLYAERVRELCHIEPRAER